MKNHLPENDFDHPPDSDPPLQSDFDIFCRDHPDLWAPYLSRLQAFDLHQQMKFETLNADAHEDDEIQAEREQIQADELEQQEQLDRDRNPEFYDLSPKGPNPFEDRDPDLGEDEVYGG